MRRWGYELIIVVAVFAGLQAWMSRGAASGAAPPLSGFSLDGEALGLVSNPDRPVLVHFWATWCGICKFMDGNIANVAADHPVITVALSSGGVEPVSSHLRDRDLQMPVLLDDSGEIGRRWGVRGVPTSFLIDTNGQIRNVTVGFTTELGLRARLLWLRYFGAA